MQAGSRLGPYEILSHIGAGGMGEVWRARDTRLGRDVAIKILPGEFAQDAKLKIRFEREARTISHLSHPNICTLFDVGHDYIVMELVEGESLAHRLARGPLPLTEVIRFGVQIAEALGQAHRQGVVHRDVKPGNVMLTKSGVKLLDFGLAKSTRIEVESRGETVQMPITEQGAVIGTFQYMAPEQLAGEEPDGRTDIFALGAVLYEMATGKRAFEGKNRTSLIGAIVNGEPRPIRELQPLTPPAFEHVVQKCLSKDPEDRWQNACDVAAELLWIAELQTPVPTEVAPLSSRLWRGLSVAMAALALVAASATLTQALVKRSTRSAPGVTTRVTRSTVDLRGAAPLAIAAITPRIGYFGTSVALSPDGTQLAYVGSADGDTLAFRRVLATDTIEPVERTRGAREVFFSPDGRVLGVITSDKLLSMPLDGGTPTVLGSVQAATRGVWRSAGEIFVGDAEGRRLVCFDPRGQRLSSVNLPDTPRLRFSDILPDRTAAVVNITTSVTISGDFSGTALFDLETKAVIPLVDRAYDARYAEPGILTFIRGGDLLAVRFDPKRRAIVGEPVTIAKGIATNSFFRRSQYALSAEGSLAFVPGVDSSRGRIAVVDRSGGERLLDVPADLYARLSLSPDDSVLAAHVSDVKDSLALIDMRSLEIRRVPAAESLGDPTWSADGQMLFALAGPRKGGLGVVQIDATSLRAVRDIGFINAEYAYLIGASTSRGVLVWDASSFFWVDPKEARATPALAQAETMGVGRLSPDGRWIAYKDANGEVYMSPIEHPDQRYQLSANGGIEPVWCRGCSDLFYRDADQWFAVRVSFTPLVQAEAPRPVWRTSFIDTPGRSYEVSLDGKYLFVMKQSHAAMVDQIRLVTNWPTLLTSANASSP